MSVVRLTCRTEMHGLAEDASGVLSVRCRGKWCRIDGRPVVHLFDLATGRVVTLPDPLDRGGERPPQEDHRHVHGRAAI